MLTRIAGRGAVHPSRSAFESIGILYATKPERERKAAFYLRALWCKTYMPFAGVLSRFDAFFLSDVWLPIRWPEIRAIRFFIGIFAQLKNLIRDFGDII